MRKFMAYSFSGPTYSETGHSPVKVIVEMVLFDTDSLSLYIYIFDHLSLSRERDRTSLYPKRSDLIAQMVKKLPAMQVTGV